MLVWFVAALTALVSITASTPAAAQQDAGDAATELATRYAPVFRLKAQDGPCDADGEPYSPIPVDAVLDNPQVLLRQWGNDDPVIMRGPSAADLSDLGEGFYLDFPGSTLSPGCIYETDNARFNRDLEPAVYARVFEGVGDDSDQVIVQYWTYWYFNDWNNKHESDWEGIALRFDAATAADALTVEPAEVGYAQHEGGESAGWDDDKLERVGDRPVVYSSSGSHASYYGAALYLGRSASEGFGCDTTDGPHDEVDPAVVVLPDRSSGPDDPHAWVDFGGRWGERQSGPFNGPTGPSTKERWDDPVAWFGDLRDSSVTVPAGDGLGDNIVGLFCTVVDLGSGALVAVTSSPITALVAIVILGGLAMFVARRTEWDEVAPLPIRRRRRLGQILRAAAHLSLHRPAIPLTGLVYLPAVAVAMLLVATLRRIPVLGDVVEVGGDGDPISIILSLLVGGLPNVFGFVLVSGAVAAVLRSIQDGDRTSPLDGVRALRATGGALIRATARATVVVLVLFFSIIGLPWGFRQLVRYQFVPSVVQLEGGTGRNALERSSSLARGRWWHTAAFTAITQTSVAIVTSLVGLLVLVVFKHTPLWAFVGLITILAAAIVPFGATAMVLLYGDAVAERSETTTGDEARDVSPVRQ